VVSPYKSALAVGRPGLPLAVVPANRACRVHEVWRTETALPDALAITAALFLVTWSTVLGAALRLGVPSTPALALATVLVAAPALVGLAAGPGVALCLAHGGCLAIGLVAVRQLVTVQRLTHRAYHDPLTGLANRTLFRDRLAAAVDHGDRPCAVLFIDLDDFKSVNDRYGHQAGDALLRAIADRLRGCVRDTDTVARLGGDEFAILAHVSPEGVRRRVAENLLRPFSIDGQVCRVHASIGVVVADPTDRTLTADQLVRRADAAMYAHKHRHKTAGAVRVRETDLRTS
jgi:diguanylate cyclase (GGDEF)-like protein